MIANEMKKYFKIFIKYTYISAHQNMAQYVISGFLIR